MPNYSSIKQLVIDETITNGGLPTFERLTELVKENFPNSKWQRSHYDWYKSQIKTGKIETTDLMENTDNIEVEKVQEQAVTEFAISIENLALATDATLPKYLSELHLFTDLKKLVATENVHTYSAQFSLWSDGAEKQRWVYLPGGEATRQR